MKFCAARNCCSCCCSRRSCFCCSDSKVDLDQTTQRLFTRTNDSQMVHSSDVRAGALGQLEALSQRLRVEWGGLGPQSGKPRLCRVLRRRLYHAVEASQHAVQLRTSRQGRHEPAHGGQRGAPQAVTQTSAQPVQEGLTEGGGALLRRRRALEGERGAAAGRTSRVELLHQRHQAVRPKQTKRRRGNADERLTSDEVTKEESFRKQLLESGLLLELRGSAEQRKKSLVF